MDDALKGLRDVDYSKTTLEHITYSLSYLLGENPVQAYAIALELLRDTRKPPSREFAKGVEDIARRAARSSLLDRQLDPWTPEMQVEKDDYDRFVDYRLQCRLRLVGSLRTQELVKNTGSNWVWYNTRCGVCRPIPDSFIILDEVLEVGKCPAAWWVTYLERTVSRVADSPCEKAFESEHVWSDLMEDLEEECPKCHKVAAREFPFFKEKLLGMVTKIVNGVRIHFIDWPLSKTKRLIVYLTGRAGNQAVIFVVCLLLSCTWTFYYYFISDFAFISASKSNHPRTVVYRHFLLVFLCPSHHNQS